MLSFGLVYILCNILAAAYPGYRSFKALESRGTDDDKQWLTYWCIFASFYTVETFAVGFVNWVPLYYEAKLCFVLWLVAPQTRGALFLYDKYLKPFLDKYSHHLEPLARQADNIIGYVPVGHMQNMVETYGP